MNKSDNNRAGFKLVYIAGYGRSGSTILDILFQQVSNVVSGGAINNIYQWIVDDHVCTCGSKLKDCEFWKIVLNNTGFFSDGSVVEEKWEIQKKVEELKSFGLLLFNFLPKNLVKEYRNNQQNIFNSICSVSGKKIVIDSSKSTRDCAGRALALSKYTNADVKMLHLVRDGRAVAWSAMKKGGSSERSRVTNSKILNFLIVLVSWNITNIFVLLTKFALPKESYHLIKYEDLCANPADSIKKIGRFLEVDLSEMDDTVINESELSIGHNLGGNEIRFNKQLKFKEDVDWKQNMPLIYRWLFIVLSWPVMKKIGY